MKFYTGYPPMKECVENLTRFTGRMDVFELVAREYVKARGLEESQVQNFMDGKAEHDWRWKKRKNITHCFRKK